MDFRLLGPLEVFDGARAVVIGGGKRRSLLALLLLHGNEVVSADRLIDELWGESPPPTAAKGLQVYVSQLRKELQNGADRDGDVLVTRANGYVLQLGPDDVDVQRFERSVRRRRARARRGRARIARRSGCARGWRCGAARRWRTSPTSAFAQQEIARLDELRLVAIEQRVDADLALGRHAQVVGELEALVREHPLRERIRGQLMLALYRCGRQAEALETYRDGRRQMSDELGLEPGPELRELEAKILAHSPELAAPAAPRRRRPRERRRATGGVDAPQAAPAPGAHDHRGRGAPGRRRARRGAAQRRRRGRPAQRRAGPGQGLARGVQPRRSRARGGHPPRRPPHERRRGGRPGLRRDGRLRDAHGGRRPHAQDRARRTASDHAGRGGGRRQSRVGGRPATRSGASGSRRATSGRRPGSLTRGRGRPDPQGSTSASRSPWPAPAAPCG